MTAPTPASQAVEAPVSQMAREAAADYVEKAFGKRYRKSVLTEGRWPDLQQAFAAFEQTIRSECDARQAAAVEALNAECERAWSAYRIAHDQAMANGAAAEAIRALGEKNNAR
jgi:hypothetical protein